MSENLVFTFYTFSDARIPGEEQWKFTGIREVFFANQEEARTALLEVRNDIVSDTKAEFPIMNIEKVQTVPIDQNSILALLNEGLRAFVDRYEIVESFEPKHR